MCEESAGIILGSEGVKKTAAVNWIRYSALRIPPKKYLLGKSIHNVLWITLILDDDLMGISKSLVQPISVKNKPYSPVTVAKTPLPSAILVQLKNTGNESQTEDRKFSAVFQNKLVWHKIISTLQWIYLSLLIEWRHVVKRGNLSSQFSEAGLLKIRNLPTLYRLCCEMQLVTSESHDWNVIVMWSGTQ